MFDYSGDACWRQPITDALTQVMGHAPVILIAGSMDSVWRTVGSELNVAALGLFAMTVISAALSWRRVDKARARIGP
ncbi:MAG: hypothetical protein Q7U28_16305 [Aquabacterium sp.]|nr:hypothetical protein [Aquabacterium sp.]